MSILKVNKEDCTGCELCAHLCPINIIKMIADDEGFYYPSLKDSECIECGKCEMYCPVINQNERSIFIDYLAGSCKNNQDTISCSSGGAASSISKAFIENGGIVYGVSYSKDFNYSEYIRVDNLNNLQKLKGSKYIQARKKNIYSLLENDLMLNNNCLFIGLPCDVAAVNQYFKKYGKFLYTIELICHGPTSSLVQQKYIHELKHKSNGSLNTFTVRYKKNGDWKPYYIYAKYDSGEVFMEPFLNSSYGTAFDFFKRPSCNICKFKGDKLMGDLMLGDFHYSAPGREAYNPHGVSVLLPHNEKGMELLTLINQRDFDLIKVNKRNALMNAAILSSTPKRLGRNRFSRILQKKGLTQAENDYVIKSIKYVNKMRIKIISIAVKVKKVIMRK